MNNYLLTFTEKLKNSLVEIETFKWFESEEEMIEFVRSNDVKVLESIHILKDEHIAVIR